MAYTHKRRERGFTLIELMVVLIILALLVTMIVPNVVGKSDEAKVKKAQMDIAMIEALLDQFYLDMDRYPTTEEGLGSLYRSPDEDEDKWKGPYPKKPISADPWGNRYVYQVQTVNYVRPNDLSVLKHEDRDWITLITCHHYDERLDRYHWRLAVRAVLVSVEPERR